MWHDIAQFISQEVTPTPTPGYNTFSFRWMPLNSTTVINICIFLTTLFNGYMTIRTRGTVKNVQNTIPWDIEHHTLNAVEQHVLPAVESAVEKGINGTIQEALNPPTKPVSTTPKGPVN